MRTLAPALPLLFVLLVMAFAGFQTAGRTCPDCRHYGHEPGTADCPMENF